MLQNSSPTLQKIVLLLCLLVFLSESQFDSAFFQNRNPVNILTEQRINRFDSPQSVFNLFENMPTAPPAPSAASLPFTSSFAPSENSRIAEKNKRKQALYGRLSILSQINRDRQSKIYEYIQQIVIQNRERIHNHNLNKSSHHKLAENQFIVYTQDEFKEIYLNNLVTPQEGEEQITEVDLSTKTKPRLLQEEEIQVDWKAARKMTSVKFQNECGSCYAFVSLGVVESAYILKGKYLNLAQQQIVDCSDDYGNKGCTGGWTGYAMKYLIHEGAVSENLYPYQNADGACRIPANQTQHKIKSYIRIPKDCDQVINALVGRPLAVAVNADGWQYYSSGIFQDCGTEINHGVVLAGVNSEYWLVKNQWGYSWGENGYMKIGRNAKNDACSICKWASYVNV